jgi:hypothetical protein
MISARVDSMADCILSCWTSKVILVLSISFAFCENWETILKRKTEKINKWFHRRQKK